MGLVFLIVIGGMLGWLAAIIVRAESDTARLRNILVGIAGALATGLAVIPLKGVSYTTTFALSWLKGSTEPALGQLIGIVKDMAH